MSDQQDFLFDDFFATDEQKTVTIHVAILGRQVPITVKAGIPVDDRLAAQRAAVKRVVKPNGESVVTSVDEAEATLELLLRCIVSWPFKTKEGKPVPVTKENIRKLLGGMDALAEAIKKIDEQGVDALDPFGSPSDEA